MPCFVRTGSSLTICTVFFSVAKHKIFRSFLYPSSVDGDNHRTPCFSHEMCMVRFAVCIYSNIYHCSSYIVFVSFFFLLFYVLIRSLRLSAEHRRKDSSSDSSSQRAHTQNNVRMANKKSLYAAQMSYSTRYEPTTVHNFMYVYIFIELCTLLTRFTHTRISHKSLMHFLSGYLSLLRCLWVILRFFRCVFPSLVCILFCCFFFYFWVAFCLTVFIPSDSFGFISFAWYFWWCLCFYGMQWQWNMNKNTAKQQHIMTRIVGWWPMLYARPFATTTTTTSTTNSE